MSGQEIVQRISKSLVIDVGEDVVNSTVLKQVVLYAWQLHIRHNKFYHPRMIISFIFCIFMHVAKKHRKYRTHYV